MKICYDDLEGIHLTKNGFLRKGHHSYIEMDCCKECGNPYLMHRFKKTEYCSRPCAQKHRKITNLTREKLSKKASGRKLTKEQCQAISDRMSKGDVVKKNIPLYDTYAHQLTPIEKVRRCTVNKRILEVMCVLCHEWFIPKRTVCEQRCQYIKGNTDRENSFYCSDKCKKDCPVFHKKKYPRGYNPRKGRNDELFYTEPELKIWRAEVLKTTNHICEYCGKKANTAHHMRPKKTNQFFALDPYYGVACCQECHNKIAHKDRECTYGYLAAAIRC